MSEFFQNLEEEEKKPQKKSVVQYKESSESQDKITNKEKRLGELHEEIFALEDSFTAKKLDAFIKNSKKYKGIFKNGLPDFVKNFFEGALGNEKTNAALKNKITKFLAPYKTESTDEIEQHIPIQEVEVKENNLELILNNKIIDLTKLEDLFEQEKKLRSLVENSNTVGMNFKIYFTLFNLYLKNKVNDYDRVMDLFMTIADLSKKDPRFMDVEFLPILIDNLSYYLNYIISILNEINYDDFETKLNELKSINEKVVSKIILEYQFLTLNKNVETEDVFFKLLHIVRKGEYEEAKKYYDANTIYSQNDRATNTILTELGILAFSNTDYAFAFKLLQQCYLNKFYNGEIYLYVTTILIEEQVIDEPFYDTFLATFRSLDDNPFLCKSEDPKMEIQRAYYYIKNYDNETAKDILARLIPGQNFVSVLDSKILIK